MSPEFTSYTADLQNRLIGRWVTRNVGGHMEWALILRPDGTGVLEIENPACCDRWQIQWSIERDQHIFLPGSGVTFRTERPRFQIGSLTRLSGVAEDVLRIFDRGQEGSPWEFFKLRHEIEIPENEKG